MTQENDTYEWNKLYELLLKSPNKKLTTQMFYSVQDKCGCALGECMLAIGMPLSAIMGVIDVVSAEDVLGVSSDILEEVVDFNDYLIRSDDTTVRYVKVLAYLANKAGRD